MMRDILLCFSFVTEIKNIEKKSAMEISVLDLSLNVTNIY